MPDIQTLSAIIELIKDNYSLKGDRFDSKQAQNASQAINRAFPQITLSPNFIHELSTLVHGNVSKDDLLKELKAVGANTQQRVSTHGLDLSKYAAILAFTKLAALFEHQDDAQLNAYKLAVLFDDPGRAMEYVADFSKKTKTAHPFHDACIVDMPEDDNWDLAVWRKIFAKHMPEADFRRSGAITKASRIQQQLVSQNKVRLTESSIDPEVQALRKALEKVISDMSELNKESRQLNQTKGELKKNKQPIPQDLEQRVEKNYKALAPLKTQMIQLQAQLKAQEGKIPPLLENIDLKSLIETAISFTYRNAKQDEVAANLFRKYGVPEKVFDEYLRLKPQIKSSDAAIPPIIVDGAKYGCEDCFIIKMKADPKSAMLGHITACCQSLGRVGAGCAAHGLTSDQGGFYILCKGKPPPGGDTSKISPKDIIAQSWAWRAQDGSLVLDSIESQPNMRNTPEYKEKMLKMYNVLAFELVTTKEIPQVKVGEGGATSAEIGYPIASIKQGIPLDYTGYRDSHVQREIADRDFPLLALLSIDMNNAITIFNALPKATQAKYDQVKLRRILVKQATPEQFASYFNNVSYFNKEDLLYMAIEEKNPSLASYLLQQGASILTSKGGINSELLALTLNNGFIEVGRQMLDIWQKSNSDKSELLNWAAQFAHKEMIKDLLQKQKVDATDGLYYLLEDSYRNPDLMSARKEIAELFIANGGDLNRLKDVRGDDSELRNHVIKTYMTHCLATKKDINQADSAGNTLLMLAVDLGLIETIESLFAQGASLFVMNQYSQTVLDKVMRLNDPKITKLVFNRWFEQVKNKGDYDLKDPHGMTLLMYAVQTDQTKLVEELLRLGANIEVTAKNNMTPLHFAAQAQKNNSIAILLKNKANLEALDKDGNTPLLIATSRNLNRGEVVRSLILAGANIDHQNEFGDSIFNFNQFLIDTNDTSDYFSRLDAWEERLIQQGQDILFQTNKWGRTLLELAVKVKHTSLVKKILTNWYERAQGTDVNMKGPSGKTLLMWAAQTGNVDLVEKLLAEGASIDQVDNSGNNAVHYAAKALQVEVMRMFAERGANVFLSDGSQKMPLEIIKEEAREIQSNRDISVEQKNVFKMRAQEISKIIISTLLKPVNNDLVSSTVDSEGKSLLMWAAELGQTDVLRFLIAKKVDLDQTHNFGVSALFYAVIETQLESIDLLLDSGAKIEDDILVAILDRPDVEVLKKFTTHGLPLLSKNNLNFINMLLRKPQSNAFKEVITLYFEYSIFGACRNKNLMLLKRYLTSGLHKEISNEKLLALTVEMASLGHVEVVKELLGIDRVATELKKNQTALDALQVSAPMKQLIEEMLKKEEVVNPFLKKEKMVPVAQTEQARIDQTHAKLWEDLFNHPDLKKVYSDPAKRGQAAEAVIRHCATISDESGRETALKEITKDVAAAEVIRSLLNKYYPIKVPLRDVTDTHANIRNTNQ